MAKEIVIEPLAPYTNHGNTVASWTLVALVVVGFIVGAVGFDLAITPIVIVGLAIMVLGVVAGIVLKGAGYGQGGSKTKYKH